MNMKYNSQSTLFLRKALVVSLVMGVIVSPLFPLTALASDDFSNTSFSESESSDRSQKEDTRENTTENKSGTDIVEAQNNIIISDTGTTQSTSRSDTYRNSSSRSRSLSPKVVFDVVPQMSSLLLIGPQASAIPTSGAILYTVVIDENTANGPVLGPYHDVYGIDTENIGDLNQDGVIDIAVGAYFSDFSGLDRGAFYIHFMSTDGSVDSTVRIDGDTPNGAKLENKDLYSVSIAGIGDLNGDGIIDLAVGAHFSDIGGLDKGVVYIHFMNTNGSIKSTVTIDDLTRNGPVLAPGDSYGVSIANLGDLDGDGVTDIAVGAFYRDIGGDKRGSLFINFLNIDGSVKSTAEINGLTPNGPTLNNDDRYGVSIENIGDLNKDGVIDIAVGTWFADINGENTGNVFIHFLNTNGSVKSTTKINDLTENGPILEPYDQYSTSIANMGDLNGDGVTDIAVGSFGDDLAGLDSGAIFIHFLRTDGSVRSTVEINDFTPNGANLGPKYFYGRSLANIGDLNGDGVTDIAVAAHHGSPTGLEDGAIYIHFLAPDTLIKSTVEVNDNTSNGPSLGNADHYGVSVASLGDLDKDGVPDIVAGAYWNDTGGEDRGIVYINFLNSDGSVKSSKEISEFTINGPDLHDKDQYGVAVASIGDLDGDGVVDLAVGAHATDGVGQNSGAFFIHFLNTDGSIKSTVKIDHTTKNGPTGLANLDSYGRAIAGLGDLNLDGVRDIAVSAYYTDIGGQDKGVVYIHFMDTNGSIKSTVTIDDLTENGPVLSNSDLYGVSVENIGDFDGDDVTDIAVGAHFDSDFGTEKGAVHIHLMNTNGSVKKTYEINASTPNGPELREDDEYGTDIIPMGDFDGNGVIDILVGAFRSDKSGLDNGIVFIHLMNADGSISSTLKIDGNTVNGPILNDSDFYGVSAANIGDVNGDGIIDLAVGAHYDDANGQDKGTVHIHLMNQGAAPDDDEESGDAGFAVTPTQISVDENGGDGIFTVVLTIQPLTGVVFGITSSDESNALVYPNTLTFTSVNWNIPQIVTVTGVDDDSNEDDTAVITVSVNDLLSNNMFDALDDKTVSIDLINDEDGDDKSGDGGGNNSNGGGGSTRFACHDPNATNYSLKFKSKPSLCKYGEVLGATTLSCSVTPYLTRPIKLGAVNNVLDVILLEQYLNTYEGANLPVDGFYSQADFEAVVKWQEKYSEEVLAPWGITKGTGYVFMTSLQKIKQVHGAACGQSIQETQILSCSKPLLVPTQHIVYGAQNDIGQVKLLEKYLNTYELAGIPVDGFYSQVDRDIVIKWQEKYMKEILQPEGLSKGTGNVLDTSLIKIKKVHDVQCSLFVINPEF